MALTGSTLLRPTWVKSWKPYTAGVDNLMLLWKGLEYTMSDQRWRRMSNPMSALQQLENTFNKVHGNHEKTPPTHLPDTPRPHPDTPGHYPDTLRYRRFCALEGTGIKSNSLILRLLFNCFQSIWHLHSPRYLPETHRTHPDTIQRPPDTIPTPSDKGCFCVLEGTGRKDHA